MTALDTAHLIPILRLCVLVGWSIVTFWAVPSFGRAIRLTATPLDWAQVTLAIVGVGLIGFQINAMSGSLPLRTDYWTAVLLGFLASAAAVAIFLVHLPSTPEGHKRGLVLSNLAILAACIVGGSLG